MNIHFKLRKQGKLQSIIVLHVFDVRFKGRKFFYSTGMAIDSSRWDKRSRRAKAIGWSTAECAKVNQRIDRIERAVLDFRTESETATLLNRADLKLFIEKRLVGSETILTEKQVYFGMFEVWSQIIDTSRAASGKSVTRGTKKSKHQTLRLVKRFALEEGRELTFENLDMAFYREFDRFMVSNGLGGNNRGKHFKEIKAILREARDRDITVSSAYQKKSWRVIREEVDNIYLDENELSKLLHLEIQGRLAVTRDLFVMACFVGQRHSDWHQIQPNNVVNIAGKDLLKIKQRKTGETVYVPVHPVVRMLFNKYHDKLPDIASLQKFNQSIQQLCKDAKLGKCVINGEEVERWTMVSTHTARRSFATNAYLSRSMDVYQIMKCTGHRSEASFLKYLKLNGRDFAMQAADSAFFKNDILVTLSKAS